MSRALAILQMMALLFLGFLMLQPVRCLIALALLAGVYRHAHWSVALFLFLITARMEFAAWATTRRRA